MNTINKMPGRVTPAPGFILLERIPPDKSAIAIFDFQDENVQTPTWAKVVAIGKHLPYNDLIGSYNDKIIGITPKDMFKMAMRAMWGSYDFAAKTKIEVGDIVAFNPTANIDGSRKESPDGLLILPHCELRAKIKDGKVIGLGEYTTFCIDMGDYNMSGIVGQRGRKDVWDSGVKDGKVVRTRPKMAMPLQYHFNGLEAARGIWVINKKYILGYDQR